MKAPARELRGQPGLLADRLAHALPPLTQDVEKDRLRIVRVSERLETDYQVQNIAVSPSFQRRGLGSRLMAHAEGAARALGHRRICLYTNRHFAENVGLYLKLGYSVDREEDVGGGIVLVHMSKALA